MPNSLKKHDVYVQKDGLAKHDFCVLVNGKLVKHDVHVVSKESVEPIAYSYNGTVLPPLPNWDKTAYPYVYMQTTGSTETPYMLFVYSRPFDTYKTSNERIYVSGTFSVARIWYNYNGDGEWGGYKEHIDHNDSSLFSSMNLASLVWSNTDVPAKDGTIYLSASEPIPVELVGYSYNGTVRPALPNWDKETYPYAHIRGRELFFSSTPITYDTGTWKYTCSTPYLLANFTYSTDATDDISWSEPKETETQSTNGYNPVQWSNHNILDENGNVYIEASAPVPISLPFTLFDGEVSTKKPDYSDHSYTTIHILYAYKIGDTLRVTFNGEVKEYTYTRQEDSFVESEGFGLWFPQYMGTYWYLEITTKTAGTHTLKIELVGVK